MKRTKAKNNNKTLIIFLAIIIIIIVISYFFFFKKDEESDNKGGSGENEVVKKEEKKELTEYEKKLEKLDNINTKISFFKEENIDRYIAYKEKNPSVDIEKCVVYVNIGLDKDFYTDIKESPNKDTNIVLANKYYSLGEGYVPNNLTKIDSRYSSSDRYMQKDATEAFNELAKAAQKEGYTIRAVSTYRSYSYQNGLYTRYASQDGIEKADTYSARAGHSEHQTGLAVDVDNAKLSYTSFGNSKEFAWMKENAYKYGFILRYTKENEWITGYKDEPWHYRYVGVEISTYIQNHPMTFEEYFVRFLDK